MILRRLFSSAALLCGVAISHAFGAEINLSTGLDAFNNLVTVSGQADGQWTVDQLAGGTGAAQALMPSSNNFAGAVWVADGPNSNWIGRTADQIDNGPALYSFYRTFDLTGYNLSSVSLSGRWTIDDAGTLNLNGTQIGSLSEGTWVSLYSFSVNAGSGLLVSGLNTLTMTITSSDDYLEGARLEGAVTGSLAPEPSSLLLIGGGAGLLTLVAIRKKRVLQ